MRSSGGTSPLPSTQGEGVGSINILDLLPNSDSFVIPRRPVPKPTRTEKPARTKSPPQQKPWRSKHKVLPRKEYTPNVNLPPVEPVRTLSAKALKKQKKRQKRLQEMAEVDRNPPPPRHAHRRRAAVQAQKDWREDRQYTDNRVQQRLKEQETSRARTIQAARTANKHSRHNRR